MNYVIPAQASAQLVSLIVYAAIAAWYVAPWLRSRSRADALIALLWVHVFRYVALQVFRPRHSIVLLARELSRSARSSCVEPNICRKSLARNLPRFLAAMAAIVLI
jgi:hypothetical protein